VEVGLHGVKSMPSSEEICNSNISTEANGNYGAIFGGIGAGSRGCSSRTGLSCHPAGSEKKKRAEGYQLVDDD
jgi:hypothetical protein